MDNTFIKNPETNPTDFERRANITIKARKTVVVRLKIVNRNTVTMSNRIDSIPSFDSISRLAVSFLASKANFLQ